MMKLLSLFIICLAMSAMAVAQKKTSSKSKSTKTIAVPAEVNTAFLAKYSDVSKKNWNKKAGGNYMATFLGNEQVKQEVEFDAQGNYLKSRSIYTKEQFPEAVISAVKKKYPDAEISEVVRFEITGVAPYYKVKIKDAAKGKYLLVSESGDVSE